ncbi:MAG: hypothetical protein LBV80_04985 [Deltaproteobacteria bacterium]|jgi:hypothetical protein|nr:hypothetical protein [Deltaproteobacteria bacterium]
MRKLILLLAAVACLGMMGCFPVQQQKITTTLQFDASETQRLMLPGKNTLAGSAMLKTRGGDVKTCAGEYVSLYPYTDYHESIFTQVYGNPNDGYRNVYAPTMDMSLISIGFMQYRQRTMCDPQGYFRFENVSDGDFYLVTRVIWEVPSNGMQGGELIQKVTLSGGEVKNTVIAH